MNKNKVIEMTTDEVNLLENAFYDYQAYSNLAAMNTDPAITVLYAESYRTFQNAWNTILANHGETVNRNNYNLTYNWDKTFSITQMIG